MMLFKATSFNNLPYRAFNPGAQIKEALIRKKNYHQTNTPSQA